MKVSEVLTILQACDPSMDVAIEQIFKEHRSIQLRSVEVLNNCVILKDHYVRISNVSTFMAFDGTKYDVPPFDERMLNIR